MGVPRLMAFGLFPSEGFCPRRGIVRASALVPPGGCLGAGAIAERVEECGSPRAVHVFMPLTLMICGNTRYRCLACSPGPLRRDLCNRVAGANRAGRVCYVYQRLGFAALFG